MAQIDNSLWIEAFRPIKIKDMVLPNDFKKFFNNILKQKEIPNLLLASPVPRHW